MPPAPTFAPRAHAPPMQHAPAFARRAPALALLLLASACSPNPSGAPAASRDPTAPGAAPLLPNADPRGADAAPAHLDAPRPPRAPLDAPPAPRAPGGAPPHDAAAPAPSAFALVELFTSEGCSSCPPADQALDELATDAERRGLRVYALSFHVDYWNSLGWTDPFSTSAYTRRQEAYAGRTSARGVYTPQMLVNGGEGFVGSDRARARRDVDRALAAAPPSPRPLRLRVDAAPAPGQSIRVELEAPWLTPGAYLNVALAERARAQPVGRGENAGRTLRHRNVVRAFETITPRGPGPHRLELPATGLDPASLVVIAYAQDPATLAVLSAEAAPVHAPR